MPVPYGFIKGNFMRKKIAFIICITALISFLSGIAFAADNCAKCQNNQNFTAIIHTQAGHQFKIEVKSNPTTGYKWALCGDLNQSFLKKVSSIYVADKDPKVGSGGKEIWTFKAVAKGTTKICLKYARPWEKDATPAEVKTYKIVIK